MRDGVDGPHDVSKTESMGDFEKMNAEDLLTIEELCAWLKVQPSWIYERVRLRTIDQLPHIKLGHYLRFEKQAVVGYLRRRRKGFSPIEGTH
jgi:hypothetical protein